ncbi:M15 family metallopeptidase [Marinicella litoralis]|uniref:D-alanyl-D-alanine carboxypeptidase-like protein n=1 Tax=Marinicella litoralis TaxID=644220 RepID=A0A4R6Y0M4_9GAMM|nr:M15 family metallopeptidase [Marinicella litoralis]TDR22468.1 D-alanyl-D-alanine carboxypeptidase-like protein [Marinicella litoralis]
MTYISTQRLDIKPTHKNCWSIFDKFDQHLIGKLFFKKQWFNIILKPHSLGLGVATESAFGLMKAINCDHYKAKTDLAHAASFLRGMGFVKQENHYMVSAETLTCPDPYLELNQSLGIEDRKLSCPFQPTAVQLIDSDIDCFDRSTKLHPQAHHAWHQMKQAAKDDGVLLQLVSAFRSMKYQAQLIQGKLDNGIPLDDILSVNTAPGHSEHHTGRAIDITTHEFEALSTSFESSPAFKWLTDRGAEFGFIMSYPKDNQYGIIYEPWHWCYHPVAGVNK